jgi:hypothetical protein
VQIHALRDALEWDGHIEEATRGLMCFLYDIRNALDRRGQRQALEGAGWLSRCYEADAWKGHPAMPSDVEAIQEAERAPRKTLDEPQAA